MASTALKEESHMRLRKVGTARRFTRPRHSLKRLAVAASVAALSLAASASPAGASVKIGQIGNPGSVGQDTDLFQATVTSGISYVVPGTGTITFWTTYGGASAGTQMTMKVFRKVADPARYQVVGHAGPRTVTPGGTDGNTFPASIPVKAGDVLGLHTVTTDAPSIFASPGDQFLFASGNLADGASGDFQTDPFGNRVNVEAVFVPANTFTLGKTQRNRKRGTATLTLNLPNAGELTASGKGAGVAAAGAVASKTVPNAGPAKLVVKAKGKKKAKLNETGKVKLNLAVTYTPTGGDPSTQSIKVKLKKKL